MKCNQHDQILENLAHVAINIADGNQWWSDSLSDSVSASVLQQYHCLLIQL